MADFVVIGAAIEGQKVDGSSRDPLKARGLQKYNGVKCFRFVATFDVNAEIAEPLMAPAVPILEPEASTSPDDKLVCDKALLHSLDDKFSNSVRARTSTHQANFWGFRTRSAARIDGAHQELLNAIEKRKALPAAPERKQLKSK